MRLSLRYSCVVTENEDVSDEYASSLNQEKLPVRTVMTVVQSLAELTDEVNLDAYDLYEQLAGFFVVCSDEVTVPAPGAVSDFPVVRTGFDLEKNE